MTRKYTPLRLSHIGSYQGVGSIFRDKNDYTAVVVDTRYWGENPPEDLQPLKNVKRLKGCLEISESLYLPPTDSENNNDNEKTVPAVVFPRYFTCPQCKRLFLNALDEVNVQSAVRPRCKHCTNNVPLKQGIYCNVDELGNLDEVNWQWLVHATVHEKNDLIVKKKRDCLGRKLSENLQFVTRGGREFLRCTECGSEVTFSPYKLKVNLTRSQPWLYDKLKYEEAGSPPSTKITEISSPVVYSPVTADGIIIPPESDNENPTNSISEALSHRELLEEIAHAPSTALRDNRIFRLANKLGVNKLDVEMALKQHQSPEIKSESDPEVLGSPGQMLTEEYEALTTERNFSREAEFITKHQTERLSSTIKELSSDLQTYASMIDQLVKVERLRKVQVFKGFKRLVERKKDNKEDTDEDIGQHIVPPDVVGESNWLPAIELFGEGIFVTLNSSWLMHWEKHSAIVYRTSELAQRYEQSARMFDGVTVSPRFLLLHTLAHLLIRELESNCGYPAASLCERIYASEEDETCGFLIYTAVADVSGSLGGLMEQAAPKNFLSLLEGALNHAKWCALDPVCSEHTGQGPDGLNLAACHGCCLVPDTSCNYGNLLLDRTLIKGDESKGIPELETFIKERNVG